MMLMYQTELSRDSPKRSRVLQTSCFDRFYTCALTQEPFANPIGQLHRKYGVPLLLLLLPHVGKVVGKKREAFSFANQIYVDCHQA